MKIGILNIGCVCYDDLTVRKTLFDKGHQCVSANVEAEDSVGALDYLKSACKVIVVLGDYKKFTNTLKDTYDVGDKKIFELNDTVYALTDKIDYEFVTETLTQIVSSKSKSQYTTAVFKTVATENKLRERLKDLIGKRSKFSFGFFGDDYQCELHVRYSSKTAMIEVNEKLSIISKLIKEWIYAYSDITLAECLSMEIQERGLHLKLAESFTGGAIASEFVKVPGTSAFLTEGLVVYSNKAKSDRLSVSADVIREFGAVSMECLQEMINGIEISKGDCFIITTGNAGPSSEKPDDVGHCFMAVGNAYHYSTYEYKFKGDRQHVINEGVKYAMFNLYKFLRDPRNQNQ